MKRILLLVLAFVFSLALVACSFADLGSSGEGGADSEGGGGAETPENLIYGHEVSPALVYAYSALDEETSALINTLCEAILESSGEEANVRSDGASALEHEIVIGDTSRDISKTATELLERRLAAEADSVSDADERCGFLIYSSGSSVAIVWSNPALAESAVDYFIDNYVSAVNDGALIMAEGSDDETFSLLTVLKEREDVIFAEKWAQLEAAIPEEHREEIIAAYRQLYSLYTDDAAVWLGNLYDPETGGFYYCNSARDNYGYLPDIESTYYAFTLVEYTGMAELYGGKWADAIPRDIIEKACEWIKTLQDPDGYFYHPQWPKEYIEVNGFQSRITRDRGSAKTLLSAIGMEPTYSGYGSSGTLTAPLGQSTVVAASKAVSTSALLTQYQSTENFKAYLDTLRADVNQYMVNGKDSSDGYKSEAAFRFYYYGNLFQSTLGLMNPEMRALTVEFFNDYQNQENGMWAKDLCYNATNGIHKVGSVFNGIGAELRHVEKIIDSTLEILMFDVETRPTDTTCNIYNVWSCFPYIYTNIRTCSPGTSAEKESRCEAIKARVFERAAEAINTTYYQIKDFKIEDGSMSYCRGRSTSTIQGCPSAVPGTREGDIGGYLLGSYDIIHYSMAALELTDYEIPLFTEHDRVVYINTIRAKEPVSKSKPDISVSADKIYDFEDTAPGTAPAGVTVAVDSGRDPNPGSAVSVTEDADGNRALTFNMRAGDGNSNGRNYFAKMNARTLTSSAMVSRLEFSLKMDSGSVAKPHNISLIYTSINGKTTLSTNIGLSSDGTLSFYESNGTLIGNIGRTDEYIDVIFEYEWRLGTYKVYADGEYVGRGTSTYGRATHNLLGQVTFSSSSDVVADYHIDNIRFVNIAAPLGKGK